MAFELFAEGEMFRNATPRLYSEGDIFWGHCYFGVLGCWDVDGRSWETGSGRFVESLLNLVRRSSSFPEYRSL
jgi:hypothetical protein